MSTAHIKPAFNLGTVRMSVGARKLAQHDVVDALLRHLEQNWGDLDELDWKENDEALKYGNRIHSSYVDRNGIKFWIITEADRSATTVLLPLEY